MIAAAYHIRAVGDGRFEFWRETTLIGCGLSFEEAWELYVRSR